MARTLTEALRGFDAAALTTLIERRPDLADPTPSDLNDLAARAGTGASVRRALDALNAFQFDVIETLAALPDPASIGDAAALLEARVRDVTGAVQALREQALLWGGDRSLHLVRAVRTAFDPYPLGLAPPSPTPRSDAEIDAALAAAGESVLPLLRRLATHPTGSVRNADRPLTPEQARTPIELALAHGLVRPQDADTVILPREVALRVREHPLGRPPAAPAAPILEGATRRATLVDHGAVGAASALLHDVELIVESIERRRPTPLRDGGLSARDVAGLAAQVDDPGLGAFAIELAAAAGLIATTGPHTLPTHGFDTWLALPTPERWRHLLTGWLGSGRWFATAGRVLGGDALAIAAPLRRELIDLLAGVEVGQQVDAAQVSAALAWRRPLWARRFSVDELVAGFLPEAGWLGLLGLGSVSSLLPVAQGRALPIELADLFPTPVDRLILQADLTAVAPGPLEHGVGRTLRQLADQESRGGGGVFRFSGESLRRAFDAGWTLPMIETWLAEHSSTGVPQPLQYLLGDVARRHGSLRVSPAGSVVCCDDPAQVAVLLARPEAAGLGLHLVAPGVVVSAMDAEDVVAALRSLGLSPVATDAHGRLLTAPAPPRAAGQRSTEDTRPDPSRVAALLIEREQGRRHLAEHTENTVEVLTRAAAGALPVLVDYVDNDGTRTTHTLTPLLIGSGMVRMVDSSRGRTLTLPLDRISAARPV